MDPLVSDKNRGWILVLLDCLLSPNSQHDNFVSFVALECTYGQRHYYGEMERVCNRLVSLENGKIVKQLLTVSNAE